MTANNPASAAQISAVRCQHEDVEAVEDVEEAGRCVWLVMRFVPYT
jgi:hypothetical protein